MSSYYSVLPYAIQFVQHQKPLNSLTGKAIQIVDLENWHIGSGILKLPQSYNINCTELSVQNISFIGVSYDW